MTVAIYGMSTKVSLPYERAIEVTRDALKREGFGVLSEIDVRATLRDKLGVTVPHEIILGACNPALAYTAMQADAQMSLLLPCNVTVREAGDGVLVSILDPRVMARLSDADGLDEVVKVAHEKLERVLNEVKGARE